MQIKTTITTEVTRADGTMVLLSESKIKHYGDNPAFLRPSIDDSLNIATNAFVETHQIHG